MNNNNARRQMNAYVLLMLGFFATILYTILTTEVYANPPGSGLGDVLCNAIGLVNGSLGRGLSTIVVISLGVGAMFGKVSWGLATIVGVGIATLSNAYLIAGFLVPAMANVPCSD